jgi:hypothetical protein
MHAPAQAAEPLTAELTAASAAPVVAEVLDPEITALLDWISAQGLAAPALDVDIVDAETHVLIVNADLAWPNGVQTGLGEPVAFELEADETILSGLSAAGYRAFASVEGLRRYLDGVLHPEPAAEPEPEPEPITAAEERFHHAMRDLYLRARDEARYDAVYLRSMIAEIGGLETARVLLHASVASDGYLALWERGRMDLTVEALVLRPEFEGLFTPDELAVARQRLFDFRAAPQLAS